MKYTYCNIQNIISQPHISKPLESFSNILLQELNLSKKDVHLTPQGYKLIASGIYQAINNAIQAN